MTVTTTPIAMWPDRAGANLCRGRCRRCGYRWIARDPVAVAREHEANCPGTWRVSIWESTR